MTKHSQEGCRNIEADTAAVTTMHVLFTMHRTACCQMIAFLAKQSYNATEHEADLAGSSAHDSESMKLAALVYSMTNSECIDICLKLACQGNSSHAAVCRLQVVD